MIWRLASGNSCVIPVLGKDVTNGDSRMILVASVESW
jgi:hypothetical protein